MLLHLWHGSKSDRNYAKRQNILDSYNFDPVTDIEIHSNGSWSWSREKLELCQSVKGYFQGRCEDG